MDGSSRGELKRSRKRIFVSHDIHSRNINHSKLKAGKISHVYQVALMLDPHRFFSV